MRNVIFVALAILMCGCAGSSPQVFADQPTMLSPFGKGGELKIEIDSPSPRAMLTNGETFVDVEGGASIFGGVRHLDLMLALDTSTSLEHTDPEDYRAAGAIDLVQSLSAKSDIQIGVVSFDVNGTLQQPLTSDRASVVKALKGLGRRGQTNIAAGIRKSLRELEKHARPGSSRVIMLFTDGKSNENKARRAAEDARAQGVAVHTLLLGSSGKGAEILQEVAATTGASFIHVTDPAKLPQAFLDLRTTGVESVTLHVKGAESIPAHLVGGTFMGRVPVQQGENRIVAVATGLHGQTAEASVTVNVGPQSCAALQVTATNDGRPAMSISDRAVEIVVDASRSMWGRMDGLPKMVVAKEILDDVSSWFPGELRLALRAYGSTSPSEQKNCADSRLLVPFGDDNRGPIRRAIAGLRPNGQTPIAYALNQVAHDFGGLQSERAVVLVTDGIESCGGDPVAAARALRDKGIVIHVIGFGIGNTADEDTASLDAVAEASGGRFLTALSAEELKEALVGTVGTSFTVFQGETAVAHGAVGSGEPLMLPEGDYRVRIDSAPPQEIPLSLRPREGVTLKVAKENGAISHSEQRDLGGYMACDEAVQHAERDHAPRAPSSITTSAADRLGPGAM